MNELAQLERRIQRIEEELDIDAEEEEIQERLERLSSAYSYFTHPKADGKTGYLIVHGDVTPEVINQVKEQFEFWEFHPDESRFIVQEPR